MCSAVFKLSQKSAWLPHIIFFCCCCCCFSFFFLFFFFDSYNPWYVLPFPYSHKQCKNISVFGTTVLLKAEFLGPSWDAQKVCATATTTPQNNRFIEQKQSLCTCFFHFGTFLCLPLQNNNVK